MSGWLEAYEKLPELQKARVQRWIHLQKLIAETLRIPFDRWIEVYVGAAIEAPFDYAFMEVTVPGFVGLDADGATFTRDLDPASARSARVPVRAQNQLGRLSPGLQAVLTQLLEGDAPTSLEPVPPADVGTLQKLFPRSAALAKLKRKDFRRVVIERSGDTILITLSEPGGPAAPSSGGAQAFAPPVEGARAERPEPLLALDVYEFAAVLNKPNL